MNLLPQLTYLFDRIHIPEAVRTELYYRQETKDRIEALLREYAFVKECNDYDQGAVDLLLIERRLKGEKDPDRIGAVLQGKKDRGEAEAVVQATELGAMVLVDEPWGRKLAERHRLNFHGIIWVLERLCELELLTPASARQHFAVLKYRDYRLPWKDVNELLERLGEKGI